MKSWRDISISIWSRDVTCPNSNQNISPGLHFQTMVLRWFWISVKRAFQRYMTWPPLTKKIFFSTYMTSPSRDPGKKNFFKGGRIIYRWKALFTLIQNHLRTMVWKWNPGEIFWFEFGHVTSRDQLEIEISLQDFVLRPLFLYDSESA